MSGRIRPFHRVLLVGVVALLSGCVLTGVVLANAEPAATDLARLRDRAVPAEHALDTTARSLTKGTAAFTELIATDDDATRTKLLTLAQQYDSRTGDAWNRFLKLRLHLPGETEIERRYSVAANETRDAATALLAAGAPGREASYGTVLQRYRKAIDAQLSVVDSLRVMYETEATRLTVRADDAVAGLVTNYLIATGLVVLLSLAIWVAALRGAFLEDRRQHRAAAQRERNARRAELETELQRGLEMQNSEQTAFEVVDAALRRALPGRAAEMLVADGPRSHFRQVLSTDDERRGPGCPVGAPPECPATIRGQTQVFGNSTGLDACPFLRERAQTAGGAICVPVGIAGRNLGVLHAVVPPGEDLDPEGIRDVQLVARKAGDRLGILRVLARTEAQAQTDPLTGLPNRRSLEDQARSVLDDDVPYVVAFADLDHFKNLNDAHGHELGDRALRMFARVLRDSVRPNDVPARFGGEEFVVVLPDCSVDDARRVAARIRERLVDALSVAAFPPFTLSIGLAPSQPGRSFTDTLGRADEALMVAKKSGRDRIVVYGEEPPPSAPGSGESVPTITTLRPGA